MTALRAPRPRVAAWLLAAAFLAAHLPFLPVSLEDLDSINFALGVRAFDVTRHQPHPPGYPIFIAAAKIVRRATTSEVRALSLVSVAAGALAALPLIAFYRRVDPEHCAPGFAFAAALVAMTAPMYWLTSARPLSDVPGLAAAVAAQVLILTASTPRAVAMSALVAGAATGIRSQIAWLTVPLLALAAFRRRDTATTAMQPPSTRGTQSHTRLFSADSAIAAVAFFAAGVAVWLIPLVIVSGGPSAYWRALFSQGAEDLSGIRMLWTTPTPKQAAIALTSAGVAPWGTFAMAAVIGVAALIGAARMWTRARPALVTLAVAFGPYLIFDLLYQESVTTRYALPLVVPVAFLATRAFAASVGWPAMAAAIGLAAFNVSIGATALAQYAREPAPVFRLLAGLESSPPAVVAMDRREALDLRRPIVWTGRRPGLAQLPSPPQHEWLEVVKHWNAGARDPVSFVADPLRADVDLFQHGEPIRYRWPLAYPLLIGGIRPNEMDWYRLDRPDWYVGEGWALTPEAAGVSDADRKGLPFGPIDAWVRASVLDGGAIVVGGRSFDPDARPRLTVAIDGTDVDTLAPEPGFFVDSKRLDAGSRRDGYARITIRATPPSRVAIEQFDAAPRNGRPIFGYGPGWNEPEYNPETGLRWRWLGERGELTTISWGGDMVLHVEGDSPLRYFSRPSRLVVRAGARVLFDRELASDFAVDVPVPAGADRILTLETSQVYVPADRSRRTHDRRHLGLRIVKCELRAAAPAS